MNHFISVILLLSYLVIMTSLQTVRNLFRTNFANNPDNESSLHIYLQLLFIIIIIES